ncbi:hypothetical protein KPL71_017470 [Citrus sinensis]|uniref:Uncharacterized protein n=1 Tax=Citrus sinensis TaxID=2711 RepID=A0ACB8JSG4_CITSI|nr:hypothetical protein KPL71_017470 [Citrus sinensis]
METTSTSSSTPSSSSSHISLSSTLSLPKSCQKHVTSKIENLIEYFYIPESAQINESQFPVMSPYNLYKQKTSFTRSIRTLISTKRPLPKEYIQSSRLDQCALQASQSEQYVTLEIPPDLVANWKRKGYTHLHLGGVRLILTLHGRKGLPVTTRIALLDTRPQPPVYNQFFGFSYLQPTLQPKPSSPKKSKSKVKISEPQSKASLSSPVPPEDSPKATPEPPKKDKGPMDQYHYHTVQTQDLFAYASESEPIYDSNPSDSTSSSSSSSLNTNHTSTDFESEYADLTSILMATKTEDPSASTTTPIVEDSSSDDQKEATTGTKPNAHPENVLREFMARSTGSLRDWLESLGEYRQLQFMQSPIGTALNIIHEQFIELQPDLQRQLTATNLNIADISLGKIFQTAMLCLGKICEQKEFFKDLMADKKPFSEACKKPYLQIECKDEKKCFCPTKKKKHFQKHFHKKSSSKKPFRYFKKKNVSHYRKKKHNRCFICKKRGHFARNCPHKSAKAVRLIQHLQHSSLLSENEDVESNFSEQSEQDDQTAFILVESSNSDDISVISTVQNVNQVSTIPRPSLKMSILPSKFHKLVPVIVFIDTGADTSMIDPSVLPSDYWENHSKLFRAVNGETFETTLITKKPIGIQFFPNYDHRIMLSKKKSSIAKESIDFLSMVITNGHYQPGPHIATELLKFPDTNLTKKQIQQFLGIINYVQDFIPKVAIHTSQLSRMLKTQCPPWGPAQTEAVKQLKVIAQSPPPLRIPISGQRILQTYASDDY